MLHAREIRLAAIHPPLWRNMNTHQPRKGNGEMNKIISLKAQNVMRIEAIEIVPDGNMVVIGGNNGEGKTSTLESIRMGLIGKGGNKKPIRDGEKSAEIEIELKDVIIKRDFIGDKQRVVVQSKEGAVFKRPQEMLSKMFSPFSLDPLEFSEMDGKEQAEALRRAMGIDTTELDIERAKVFEKRTGVNRDVKARKAELDDTPLHKDVPETIPSTSEIFGQIQQAQQYKANKEQRAAEIRSLDSGILDLEQRIEMMQADLEQKRAQLKDWNKQYDSMPDPVDTEPLEEQMRDADTIRAKHADNERHAEKKEAYEKAKAESEDLTTQLAEIDGDKLSIMESADFPIPGITINDDGLIEYNGIPFSQASSAERIRVGAAMALAMNPDLGIILIKDGSLMDKERMAELHNFVNEHDAQVWIERVGDDDPMAIIIEDGKVAEAPKKGGKKK